VDARAWVVHRCLNWGAFDGVCDVCGCKDCDDVPLIAVPQTGALLSFLPVLVFYLAFFQERDEDFFLVKHHSESKEGRRDSPQRHAVGHCDIPQSDINLWMQKADRGPSEFFSSK
jgi:hypothetical protein